jgi:hypothetical protein
MTCRYAHKRIAVLFTMVQSVPAARVIDWPQKTAPGPIPKSEIRNLKPEMRGVYADK